MLIKKVFLFFIISSLFCNLAKSQEIIIVSKVDNEIITNIDIEIEKNYLLLLNKKLINLNKKELFNLAKNSLVREKIKRKEINKLFEKRDEKIKKRIIENFYSRLGFKKKNEFLQFLTTKQIKFDNIEEKLIVEAFWNQLIYIKFKDKVRIDKKSIEGDIIKFYNTKDKKYEFNLSEIVIDFEKDITLKKKEILAYIEEFGFKVAANKYSKSDTSKYGGEIGWIKSSRLTKNVKNELSVIKIGGITKPIQSSNGYLFLKLNDKREIKEKLDLKNELNQQIEFEKNRQLNQFSLNYYKKLKKNTRIYDN